MEQKAEEQCKRERGERRCLNCLAPSLVRRQFADGRRKVPCGVWPNVSWPGTLCEINALLRCKTVEHDFSFMSSLWLPGLLINIVLSLTRVTLNFNREAPPKLADLSRQGNGANGAHQQAPNERNTGGPMGRAPPVRGQGLRGVCVCLIACVCVSVVGLWCLESGRCGVVYLGF